MNSFDPKMPYAYTPGPVHEAVQDNNREVGIGGITNVFRRHVNLTDQPSPRASKYTLTGERFTYFGFFDFNAMYPHCMRKKMPLTAGIHWKLQGVSLVNHRKMFKCDFRISL